MKAIIGVGAVIAVVALSYAYMVNALTAVSSVFTAVEGGVTVNLILLYFFWGVMSDRIGKGRSRAFGWVVFCIGLAAITLTMRFAGGMHTLLG